MTTQLPYDPRKDEAVAIAQTLDDYIEKHKLLLGQCDNCGIEIIVNKLTGDFAGNHETPVVCTDCATRFAKGEL